MRRMTNEEFADKLVNLFPDKASSLSEHFQDYGELLGHVFFAEEIGEPLIVLLRENKVIPTIVKYCSFIEEMWICGSEGVQNIVDVTLLERLSDESDVWVRFGTYISDGFKAYINDIVINENVMMWNVPRL